MCEACLTGFVPLTDVTDDLDGKPRPAGAGWDAGCYEFGAAIFADGFESD